MARLACSLAAVFGDLPLDRDLERSVRSAVAFLLHPLAAARLAPFHCAGAVEIRNLDEYVAAQSFGLALMRLSPGTLFTEDGAGPARIPRHERSGRCCRCRCGGAKSGCAAAFGKACLLIWPQITGLIAGMIVVFARRLRHLPARGSAGLERGPLIDMKHAWTVDAAREQRRWLHAVCFASRNSDDSS